MSENTTEDPPLTILIGVEHRFRPGLVGILLDSFVGGRQHLNLAQVTLKWPVSLVKKVNRLGQAEADWVIRSSDL